MSNLVDKKIVSLFSITFLLIGFAFGFGVAKLTDKKSDANVGEQIISAIEKRAEKQYEKQMNNDAIKDFKQMIEEDKRVLNDSSKSEKEKEFAERRIRAAEKQIKKLELEIEKR